MELILFILVWPLFAYADWIRETIGLYYLQFRGFVKVISAHDYYELSLRLPDEYPMNGPPITSALRLTPFSKVYLFHIWQCEVETSELADKRRRDCREEWRKIN